MKKILCSLLLLCLVAGTAAAQSLFADLPEGEIILTFKDIARELSRGWQQTCPRPNGTNLIINIPVELPETQQLSVISVSPQPAFSPSLLTRYIPDAQENIRNEPGDFFQFYGGERTDHIIRSASRSEEIFSDRLPKVEFMHGMTFRDLRHNGFNVFDEAHAQHFVSFIQNQTAQFREVQSATFQVVQQTARSTDNDLRPLTQGA